MLDTVFYAVDIETKKKQLLHQLGDLKLSPAVDDRIRKQVDRTLELGTALSDLCPCPGEGCEGVHVRGPGGAAPLHQGAAGPRQAGRGAAVRAAHPGGGLQDQHGRHQPVCLLPQRQGGLQEVSWLSINLCI